MVGSTVPADRAQTMPLDTENSGFAKLLEELKAEYLSNDDVNRQQAATAGFVKGVLDGDDKN